MFAQVQRWVRRSAPGARAARFEILLPRLTLAAGAFGGAAYSAQSARHMIVAGPDDKLLVSALLTALAALVGWLAGLMLVSIVTAQRPTEEDGARAGAAADSGAQAAGRKPPTLGSRRRTADRDRAKLDRGRGAARSRRFGRG